MPSSPGRSLINEEDTSFDKEDDRIEKDTKYSWFVCSCSFFSQVFVYGVLHAYGVFFVEFLKDFKTTKGEAAWIGSLAYGLSMTFGPVTSFLITRFGYRPIMMAGGTICATSLVVSSFSTSTMMLFLTFSVFYGIGTCMTTSPTMTITSEYFDRYLSIATGVTVAGSSFGTLIMGPLSQIIIDKSGWRTAFRVYAGLCLSTVVFNSRIQPLKKPSRKKVEGRSFIHDLQIWKNRVFVIWTMAISMVMFGFYIPYVHLVSYAIDQGITADRASIFMLILGATTATGRILFGKIVQWGILNRLHMHQLSMVVTGAGVMLLPIIKSFWGIMMYVVVVGLVDGCFVVLLPIMTASLVGVENSVLAWGFMIGTCSVTFTIGPPIAGALYDMTGTYNLSFHCAGIPILAGAVLLFFIPWAQRTSGTRHVLEIINDYTINDTTMTSRDGAYHSESARTVCHEEEVQKIDIIRSGVSIRTTGTSPMRPESFLDKSVGTDDFPIHRYQMDIEDALSQLSANDKMFDDMLRQSYDSRSSPQPIPDSSIEIPRLPPPSGSLRLRTTSEHSSNTGSAHDKSSLQCQSKPRPPSINIQSDSSSFLQPSITSNQSQTSRGETHESYLSSASKHFSYTMDPPLIVQAKLVGGSDSISQQQQASRSSSIRSASETEPAQKPSDFDQTISEQVSLIRKTLKSPIAVDVEEILPIATKHLEVSAKEGICPEITIQGPTPVHSFNADGKTAISSTNTADDNQAAGPSSVHSLPLHVEQRVDKDTHAISDSKFECENQITIIPGNNPFKSTNKKQNDSGSPQVKLEDLFKPIKSEEDTRDDVSAVDSSDAVVATKSQTGELDVFKHLFDDDETQ